MPDIIVSFINPMGGVSVVVNTRQSLTYRATFVVFLFSGGR
jgi:hypothetical protein